MYTKLIAHRGNMWGPIPKKENSPAYIKEAIQQGFDVEVDLWKIDRAFFLGHDKGKYKITEKWLYTYPSMTWFHCKNSAALEYCISYGLHCFWHQNDDYTLTSNGYIWTYPGKVVPECGVLVDKNLKMAPKSEIEFICSDYVGEIKKNVGS